MRFHTAKICLMKIIDLSKTIEYKKEDPWFMRIKIKHKPHKKSKFLIRYFLGLKNAFFRRVGKVGPTIKLLEWVFTQARTLMHPGIMHP